MQDTKKYIEALFLFQHVDLSSKNLSIFENFVTEEKNINAVNIILENQKQIMANWKLKTRIEEIVSQVLMLPNGTVNKPYEANIDFGKLGWNDVAFFEISGLEETGLNFDLSSKMIKGDPLVSGDLKLKFLFRLVEEDDSVILHEKNVTIIINPDPKTLWKNIGSDLNDPFWKDDDVFAYDKFLDKNIVVASKRGRSHANVGSFRDDHFAFKSINDTGWDIIAVSDGAGSASLSRQGSKLSCEFVINYFEENFTEEILKKFDNDLLNHYKTPTDENSKEISLFVYNNLSKAAWHTHKKLEQFAQETERPLKDFHATLIFALVKKYDFGYAVISFGVGDCPIGLLNKDLTEIKLMNWLDVGEFGGGTRFITMPEIFQNDKFSTRFGFKLIDDFSYLMLMSDGIYDPKFIVEANLEKIDKWKEFLSDLNGQNKENVAVNFESKNEIVAEQLSLWMDFWDAGNHDDRTLAIIY